MKNIVINNEITGNPPNFFKSWSDYFNYCFTYNELCNLKIEGRKNNIYDQTQKAKKKIEEMPDWMKKQSRFEGSGD